MILGARQTLLNTNTLKYWGLCLTAAEKNTIVSMNKGYYAPTISLLYSFDGKNWFDFIPNYTTITLQNINDSVYFKSGLNGNNRVCSPSGVNTENYGNVFSATGQIVASGDIMSVLNGEQPIELNNADNSACLARIFANCKSLIDASQLIFSSKTLTNNCYRDLFISCENLKYPPILPATSLYDNCYRGMFANCSSLLHAPILPAPILQPYCYQDMFYSCTNLNNINVNFSAWNPTNATANWVTNITTNGTFICPTKLLIQYGASYIPSNWTIKN